MRVVWICIQLVTISFQCFTNSSATAAPVSATVEYCHDGDTCRLRVSDGLWMNVRLAGIDAPEVKSRHQNQQQVHGEAARDFLNQTIKTKIVRVEQRDLDRYNRPIVELYLEKQLINQEMVERGYAEVYAGKKQDPAYKSYVTSEIKAKVARLGIWGLKEYESPSSFRKKHFSRSRR